jgi:tripartite-type tricarboxylate transporter receptor subunit TctC
LLGFSIQEEKAMRQLTVRQLIRTAFALGLLLTPGMAHAQDAWPSRNIIFIVPYAAGGYTDLVGRLAARYVENALGKPVMIDNRAGAGGIVGTQAVANATPDGYTFCVCSIGAISIAPFIQRSGMTRLRISRPSASSARSRRWSSSTTGCR